MHDDWLDILDDRFQTILPIAGLHRAEVADGRKDMAFPQESDFLLGPERVPGMGVLDVQRGLVETDAAWVDLELDERPVEMNEHHRGQGPNGARAANQVLQTFRTDNGTGLIGLLRDDDNRNPAHRAAHHSKQTS